MSMYAKVRRLRLREGLTIREIAWRTSSSLNTMKAWLREPAPRTQMAYQRPSVPKVLEGFTAWLDQAVNTDENRPRKKPRTARRLYERLQEQGFIGPYCRVTEYLRAPAGGGWFCDGPLGLRAATVWLVPSIPVRLERGRAGDRRDLAQGDAGAHEAVR